MKVAFIVRSTIYSVKGGDTVQVTNTAEYLQQLGVTVTIHLSTDHIDYSTFDLLHFFNIIRPADILYHIQQSNKPYVVSTIFVDYSEYDKKYRKGLTGVLFKLFSTDKIEYVKTIARAIRNGEKLASKKYIWMGHRKAIIHIIKNAALLLPNSANEYKRLANRYKVEQRYVVIPNGINPGLFKEDTHTVKDPAVVLQVARIEGIKNQVNLIKALNNSAFQLYIIGHAAPNQPGYYNYCKQVAASNITFISGMPQQELLKYYAMAKVHVLPSWFETTGLSSLEAAAMGCNIVVSDKGDVRDYFGNDAFYCNPGSPDSILEAVQKASGQKQNKALQTKVITQYTWTETAKKTLEAYRQIVNNKG